MINRNDLQGLKKSYNEALQKKATIFMYKGQPFATSYAKYLIEYLEM